VTLLDKLFRNQNNGKISNQSSLTLLVLMAGFSTSLSALEIDEWEKGHYWINTSLFDIYQNAWGSHSIRQHYTAFDAIQANMDSFLEVNSSQHTVNLLSYAIEAGRFGPEYTATYMTAGEYNYNFTWRGVRQPCPGHKPKNDQEPYYACDFPLNLKQSRLCSADNPLVEDPIVVANGNSFQTEVDYKSQSPFGLNFSRYYNSTAYETKSDVGFKWSHNFNRRVSSTGNNTLVYRENGQAFVFNYVGTIWVGDVDIPDTLLELVDEAGVRTGWEYKDSSDTTEVFNVSGQLISVSNRAGQTKTFAYDVTATDGGDDNSDTLDKVVGFGGEEMLFSYDTENRISSMTDPEGNSYRYSYDDVGNLESVVYPYDTPLDDSDNPTRTYHYENTSFPSHLTGLTDETESRVTWAFDSEGRAISSEMQGGVDKSTLDFSVADQVTVTNPLGKDTTYHFETLHGVKKVTKVEGHATESCAGANQNYSYDANGYIESKTDWQGNVTTYVHNERGLETSRTEASGTDEARTITTQWHDDFRLPLKVTSPGQVTNFVYDDKGRLLSQTTHDVQ